MKCSENQMHTAFLRHLCGYTPKEIAKELSIHFTTVGNVKKNAQNSLQALAE